MTRLFHATMQHSALLKILRIAIILAAVVIAFLVATSPVEAGPDAWGI
jgi:hypothetical protein